MIETPKLQAWPPGFDSPPRPAGRSQLHGPPTCRSPPRSRAITRRRLRPTGHALVFPGSVPPGTVPWSGPCSGRCASWDPRSWSPRGSSRATRSPGLGDAKPGAKHGRPTGAPERLVRRDMVRAPPCGRWSSLSGGGWRSVLHLKTLAAIQRPQSLQLKG